MEEKLKSKDLYDNNNYRFIYQNRVVKKKAWSRFASTFSTNPLLTVGTSMG